MAISKEDWALWKESQVTKEIQQELNARIDYLKEKLLVSAGLNQGEDRFIAGYAAGMKELINIDVQFEEDKVVEGELVDAA